MADGPVRPRHPRTAPVAISLVLPAYNEAAIIGESVAAVKRRLEALGLEHEILVGDDGSTDGTEAVARGLGMSNVRVVTRAHGGKGAILSACLPETSGEIAGFIDADLGIDPAYLGAFVRGIEDGHDAVVASKTMDPGLHRGRPLRRRAPTLAYNALVRRLFGSPLSDHQAGLKLFRGDLVRRLVPRVGERGWLWDTELMLLVLDAGARILEVPVSTHRRRPTKVNLLRGSASMLVALYRLHRRRRRA